MKGDPSAFESARNLREGRWFLRWARFPYSVVEESEDGTTIYLADARYVRAIDDSSRGFGVVALKFDE